MKYAVINGVKYRQMSSSRSIVVSWSHTNATTALVPLALTFCIAVYESDAKQILTAFPLENWRRSLGRPCTMWMKTTQQDLKSMNLSLNEAVDMAQDRPLWRLMSTFGTTHSQWCMPEMNELINELQYNSGITTGWLLCLVMGVSLVWGPHWQKRLF